MRNTVTRSYYAYRFCYFGKGLVGCGQHPDGAGR